MVHIFHDLGKKFVDKRAVCSFFRPASNITEEFTNQI